MKFISLSLPIISHQGKKYCSEFRTSVTTQGLHLRYLQWAPSRVGAKVSRKMARIFCWMLACLLLLHCVDCNGIGAYHKVTLRRQRKHKLEKFVVREFVRQHIENSNVLEKIIHHYNTTTINGTHFEPKHFSALISHTFSNIHSLVPVMLGSQVLKTAAATLLETEEKRLKLRSSPSLRVLSKNEMDLSSQNRFRLKRNQNSKILPMLPSAPKPPAIPPSFYPPAGPPLPGVNGFANMKYIPMAVKLVKQHQELFDQTFGRVFDPESVMMEKNQGCRDMVQSISSSPCINTIAN